MAGADRSEHATVHRVGALDARVGDLLPEVRLPATSGRELNLMAESRQRHLVLFFYPGDRDGLRFPELSGCTAEACSFRDHATEIRALGAEIFGISTGTTARQHAFVEREDLAFELLSDPQHQLIDRLGIPLWRSEGGEEFVTRTTFVVRRGGRIATIFEDVTVLGHLDAVLASVTSLES